MNPYGNVTYRIKVKYYLLYNGRVFMFHRIMTRMIHNSKISCFMLLHRTLDHMLNTYA